MLRTTGPDTAGHTRCQPLAREQTENINLFARSILAYLLERLRREALGVAHRAGRAARAREEEDGGGASPPHSVAFCMLLFIFWSASVAKRSG